MLLVRMTWKWMVEITNIDCTNSGLQSMQKVSPSQQLRADHISLLGAKQCDSWTSRMEPRCKGDNKCYSYSAAGSTSSSVEDAGRTDIWNKPAEARELTSTQARISCSTAQPAEELLTLPMQEAERFWTLWMRDIAWTKGLCHGRVTMNYLKWDYLL